ncbi:hypothetical protein DU508_03505 [Pedobacter chinensis]|uniref:CHASE3 domain-containing protein n=1 Tax=Pedobacter chinensis TaxID=2282421 RepID=A0A369Q6W5_9SPHI|nr:CHASE3 domain-containing protein [Pedobacter chinensis]RDC58028.1 hypothetical protein DU508_03505 [Pedobacter chinensis]
MNNSLFNRPTVGFVFSIILTIATSALSYYYVQSFFDSEKWVTHTNQVRGKLETIISSMKDAETGQRGFLLTGNEKFLEPYIGSKDNTLAAFDTVKTLTLDNPAQQSEFKGLKALIIEKYRVMESTISQKRDGGQISEEVLLMGKSYMDRTRTIITRMESREELLLAIRLSTLNLYAKISLVSIVVAFIFALGSTLYFYRRALSDFEDRVRLEQEVKKQTSDLEKKINILKDFSEKVGNGEYGVKIKKEDLE